MVGLTTSATRSNFGLDEETERTGKIGSESGTVRHVCCLTLPKLLFPCVVLLSPILFVNVSLASELTHASADLVERTFRQGPG